MTAMSKIDHMKGAANCDRPFVTLSLRQLRKSNRRCRVASGCFAVRRPPEGLRRCRQQRNQSGMGISASKVSPRRSAWSGAVSA